MAKEEGQSSSSLNSNSNSDSRDKQSIIVRPRVPFHIATIPRPQEEYNIRANNLNELFQHVWLETSEDGSRFIHPLEKFSELDFADQNVVSVDPVKPLPMECTSFKLVENLKDLKELVAKLHAVNEFAVDLEHNKYRSFQGLTCLMQISTRTEDFVVDTLKLRIHIGPFLREFFKDPSKKKVMHGADCDILWLQRDFSIYVCNLFDTGQASRVLQLERNSLEYLLSYFCGVFVNKDYQHADWRQRPLPDEMLKYARQDTHYLFYLHDIMKGRLISESRSCEDGNDLLLEVYKRSYDVCLQLYEKELFTDMSYLYTYGLQGADFNAQQLSVVAGLCEWRDTVARQVDESTGYILPNKALLDIARQMPLTSSKLRRLVKSKHPHVEWNLISVLDVIKDSIQKASAFERAAQELQKGPQEMVTEQKTVVSNAALQGSEEVPIYMLNRHFQLDTNRVNGQATKPHLTTTCIHVKEDSLQFGGRSEGNYFELSGNGGEIQKEAPFILKESSISRQMRDSNIKMADVRPDKTEKMDQIKTIILPFDLLDGRNKTLQ